VDERGRCPEVHEDITAAVLAMWHVIFTQTTVCCKLLSQSVEKRRALPNCVGAAFLHALVIGDVALRRVYLVLVETCSLKAAVYVASEHEAILVLDERAQFRVSFVRFPSEPEVVIVPTPKTTLNVRLFLLVKSVSIEQ